MLIRGREGCDHWGRSQKKQNKYSYPQIHFLIWISCDLPKRWKHKNLCTFQYQLISWIVYLWFYTAKTSPAYNKSWIQHYLEHIGKKSQTFICRFQTPTPSDMKSLCGIYGYPLPYLSPKKVLFCIFALNIFASNHFSAQLIGHKAISL